MRQKLQSTCANVCCRGFITGLVFVAAVSLSAVTSPAQVLYGSIVGNVTDPNGAVVPEAPVTAVNQGTGVTSTAVTNNTGSYSFVALQPGTYAIKVSMRGFKTLERRNLVVEANSITRTDVKLDVGDIEQSVTITSEAPALQTDRAETRSDVTTAELENLPVPPGRNYQQLYRTLPGFSPPVNSHSIPTNPSQSLEFHVNGTSDDQNNTRIDGVSSTTVQLPHVVSYIPALESIQEVNVVTGSFDAEQGLAGGASINVQIKSGTNDLHGSAFEYHTNQHLQAWPESVPPGQSEKPKAIYNQFGGTVGGPIKKDKLFYFASYEGTFDHRNVQKKFTVPTDAMKNGDFSQFLSQGITIYNPYANNLGTMLADPSQRVPMAAPGDPRCDTATNPGCLNIIPSSLLNTPSGIIAQKMNSLWPTQNLPGLSNNYFASGAFGFDRNTLDTKVNWNVNEKFNTFGRFSFLHYLDTTPTAFQAQDAQGPPIGGTSNPGHGSGNTYSTTFGATYIFRPNLVMDAYFGFTLQGTNSEQLGLGTNVGLDTLGIPGTNGTRKFESGWPEFELDGFTTIGNSVNYMPYYRHDPQYQYVVNLDWTHGKHDIRFGTDIYRQGLNQTQAEWIGGGSFYGAQGGFNFGQQITALCQDPPDCSNGTSTNRANSYAAFLLGLPDQASKSLQFPDEYHIRSMLYSAYIRDRWNVTPRLTVNYGVRWEYFPYPTRTDRGLERYDPTINKVLVCGVGQVPKDCGTDISKTRFSPRFGIAYRATDTFVIRAGFGITNDPYEGLELMRNNYPIMEPFGLQPPNSFTPATTLALGLPSIPAPVIPSSGILDLPLNVGFEGQPKDLHRGYIESWNLTLQKELGKGFTAQAGYVATRSVRQLGFIDINASQVPYTNQATQPLFQQWGRTAATTFLEPLGTGHFDSLQASLKRRFSAGLMLNVNYTWSKSINFVDASSGTPYIQSQQYLKMNRALTGFDIPQNLAVTSLWELPFGKGKRWLDNSGMLAKIVSGWQVNNLVSIFDGTPFNVVGSCGAGWPGNSPTMANLFGSPKKVGDRSGYWYDPLAFGQTYDPNNPGSCAEGALGNSGFNNLRGPSVFNWDFGVFRDFPISERFHLQFRAESFNFTNTPHFCNPDNDLGNANGFDPQTGRVTDPGTFMTLDNGVCDLARAGVDQRQFRFGLRFQF